MKMLEDTKHVEDTLVMFVSEQGSSFPFGGKWSVYDNGVHASAVVRWPGKVKPGSRSDALLQYVDVPPTFLAAAGIDPTKIDVGCPDAAGGTGFDGRSFLPILLGEGDHLRDYVFFQHTTLGTNGALEAYPMRAVRDPNVTSWFATSRPRTPTPLEASTKVNLSNLGNSTLKPTTDWLIG